MLEVAMRNVRRTDGSCSCCSLACCCTNIREVEGFRSGNRCQRPVAYVARKLQSADAAEGPKATTSLAEWSGQRRWSIWEKYLLRDRSWRVRSCPPGSRQTLQKLTDQSKRPREARVPIPPRVREPQTQQRVPSGRSFVLMESEVSQARSRRRPFGHDIGAFAAFVGSQQGCEAVLSSGRTPFQSTGSCSSSRRHQVVQADCVAKTRTAE